MQTNKKQVSVLFMLFSTLFCVCLITANVLETKQVSIGLFNLSITGGLIVFPISYIINDCVCEVWGYSKTRLLIWLGFAMNFLFVTFGALCDALPAAPYWDNDAGFHAVFGLAPRIGKNFSARAILSTVYGEIADSLIFFPLALGGVVPMKELPVLIVSQVVLKTLYEIIVLPITIRVVRATKKLEGEDTYDKGVNYSVWKILSI